MACLSVFLVGGFMTGYSGFMIFDWILKVRCTCLCSVDWVRE